MAPTLSFIFHVELVMTFHRLGKNTNVRERNSIVIKIPDSLLEFVFPQVISKTSEHLVLQRVGKQMSLSILNFVQAKWDKSFAITAGLVSSCVEHFNQYIHREYHKVIQV